MTSMLSAVQSSRQLKLELAYRGNASVTSAGPHWRKRSDLVHQTAR
jgi:hypothetical protein